MLRITSHHEGSDHFVRVAGRLDERYLAELRKHCDVSGGGLVIDLSELQGADVESIGWLRTAADRGATIIGASPYIALLLERSAPPSVDLPEAPDR